MNPPCRETWALYTTKLHDSQLFSPQSNTAWWKYSRLERKNDFTRFRGMGGLRLFVDKRGDGPSHHVSQGYPLLGRLGFKLLVKFRGKFNRQRQGNVYLNIGNGIGRWCWLRGWHLNHHPFNQLLLQWGKLSFWRTQPCSWGNGKISREYLFEISIDVPYAPKLHRQTQYLNNSIHCPSPIFQTPSQTERLFHASSWEEYATRAISRKLSFWDIKCLPKSLWEILLHS